MSHRPRLPILSAVVYSLIVSFTLPSKTEAVPGDLNLDGVVDFDDFFIFSDHFGEAGSPDMSSVVYLYAPHVSAPSPLYVVPQPNLSPTTPGLRYELRYDGFLGEQNWDKNFDADLEADGLSLYIFFRGDERGGTQNSDSMLSWAPT